MTDAIWLGEVFITDLNDNDFYDPKLDRVTDLSGKTLSLKEASQKLKGILKTIGAKEWKELSLFSAQEYLASFREAERLAGLGEVDQVEELLTAAEEVSANLPISFNQKRANGLREDVRLVAIDLGMVDAQELEKASDWNNVLETLKEIELWDLELRGDFGTQAKYDDKEYERLLKESYEKLFTAAKNDVAKHSPLGHISLTKELIAEMIDYSQFAKKRFGLDLKVTQKEIDGWMKDAYNKGIPNLFNRIFDLAHKGQVQLIRRLLPELNGFLSEAKQQYGLTYQYTDEMLDNIYETALLEGIEDNYKQAEEAAQNSQRERAERLIAMAQEYVDEYNQKYPKKTLLYFDSGRASDILACAWDAKNCP